VRLVDVDVRSGAHRRGCCACASLLCRVLHLGKWKTVDQYSTHPLTPQGKIVLGSIFPLWFGSLVWSESWLRTRHFSFQWGIQTFGQITAVLSSPVKLGFGSLVWPLVWSESWLRTHRGTCRRIPP
jgi:hypothetical protein